MHWTTPVGGHPPVGRLSRQVKIRVMRERPNNSNSKPRPNPHQQEVVAESRVVKVRLSLAAMTPILRGNRSLMVVTCKRNSGKRFKRWRQ
jgi:hypothetical protein